MPTKRLKPDWPFPSYSFRPGVNPHPHKEGGHGLGLELEENPFSLKDIGELETSSYFLFALDLYNHGFYWESHVYWEALWNAFGRQGRDAWALQGLIKMAAAGLKFDAGQISAAKGHLDRAQELFLKSQGANSGSNKWCGLDLTAIIAVCAYAKQDQNTLMKFALLPLEFKV